MKTLGLIFIAFTFLSETGWSKIIGLVEIPNVISVREPHGSGPSENTENSSGVQIYQRPDLNSESEKVTRPEKFSTREYANEREGVDVLETRKSWFLVKLRSGEGWLNGKDAGPFHPL